MTAAKKTLIMITLTNQKQKELKSKSKSNGLSSHTIQYSKRNIFNGAYYK